MASNNNIAGLSKCAPDKVVQINRGFIKVIKAILHSAVDNLTLVNATVIFRCVNIQQYRHLIINDTSANADSDVPRAEEEFIISTQLSLSTRSANDESVCIPINFDNNRVGYLIASFDPVLAPHETRTRMDNVVLEIVSVIKRYQIRDKIINTHGDQAYWIGCSSALRQLDQLNEELAKTQSPVLIRGNKGTGKSLAARTLHCYSCDTIAPFIESSCDKWESAIISTLLKELWAAANGGTLFLRNVDKLSPEDFNLLKTSWHAINNIDANSTQKNTARLMMSLSSSFIASENQADLAWSGDIEELHVPELKERLDDIRDLTRFFIGEYQLNMDFDFDEEAWKLLTAYHWPGNVPQLKAMIQKLATMIERPRVMKADLLRLCPELESTNDKLLDAITFIKPVAVLKTTNPKNTVVQKQSKLESLTPRPMSTISSINNNRNFYGKGAL